MMTFQISSSLSRSSQAGITEFQGVDSFGRPGPPLAIRQKRNAPWSIAMVPGAGEVAGGGLTGGGGRRGRGGEGPNLGGRLDPGRRLGVSVVAEKQRQEHRQDEPDGTLGV